MTGLNFIRLMKNTERLKEISNDLKVYAEEIPLLARSAGKDLDSIYFDLNKAVMKIKRLMVELEDKIEFT